MDRKLKKSIIQIGIVFILASFLLFNHMAFKSAFTSIIKISFPFIVGGVLALFLNVLLNIIERLLERSIFRKKKRPAAMRSLALVLSLILLVLALSILVGIVIPTLLDAINRVLVELPKTFNSLIDHYRDTDNEIILNIIDRTNEKIRELGDFLQNNINNIVLGSLNAVQSTLSSLFTGFLSVIFSLYLLINKEKLAGQVERFLIAFSDQEWTGRVICLGQRFNFIFTNFIQGAVVESAIFALMIFIPMKILGLPYAATVSILIAVFQIIPYFGAFISGGIGFILVTSSGIRNGMIFLVMLIILQQIESNIVYPKIVGEKVGLPGIWVMVSVTIFGSIMGLSGMVIAVPIATTFYYLMGDLINYRIQIKKGKEAVLSQIMKDSLDRDKSSI